MSRPASPLVRLEAPVVDPPPAFVERRVELRRAADRAAHADTVLLARAVDALAADRPAADRLAAILGLLARTVGADRAAVLSPSPDRRVAAIVGPGDDSRHGEELAGWLDAAAPRTRAQRAADPPAEVLILEAAEPIVGSPSRREPARPVSVPVRAAVALPNGVQLGFDLPDDAAVEALAERLPESTARHAAALLALATRELAHEAVLDELRAREAERSRFISTVAHELRTPLTGLGGYLDLLLDGRVDDPDVTREFLGRGRAIVDSVAALVGDLLELSRLDAGSLRLELAPFSVAELGRRVAESVEPIAEARSVTLATTLPPRLQTATGDPRRVEQILTNLVGNALKFVPAGGHVELAARVDGGIATIAVRDDGAGIDPEDRPRIFERFFRMAAHERVTGTGLGLPIARELAEAMGGALDVASVPGSGSAFVLVLPGPAGADPGTITGALGTALREEEARLSDRAVLSSARSRRLRIGSPSAAARQLGALGTSRLPAPRATGA